MKEHPQEYSTAVGWRKQLRTERGIEQHAVLQIILRVASRKLAENDENFASIGRRTGISKQRLSSIYRQKYIGKESLKLLIGYGYLKLDDILPEVSTAQLKILMKLVPEWA